MYRKTLVIAFFLMLCHISFAQEEKRLALVIGNSEYASGRLNNAVNDANKVSSKLKTLGFDVMLRNNVSNQEMGEAINDFTDKATNYDVALFYYAGHGIQSEGRNYLIPVNDNLIKKESDIKYYSDDLNRLLGRLEDSGCKLKIIILDACRNNPFERSWHRSTASKGLAFVNAPNGTLIAYATSPGSVADDGTGASNSPYTTALLQTLEKPSLSILDFFNEVGNLVARYTKGKQTPWISNSPIEGDFKFNPTIPSSKKDSDASPTKPSIASSDNNDFSNHQTVMRNNRLFTFNLSPANAIVRFNDQDATTYANGESVLLKIGEYYSFTVEADGYKIGVGSFFVGRKLPFPSINLSLQKSESTARTLTDLSQMPNSFRSKVLDKALDKEIKYKRKEFKEGGWVINDTLRSLDEALRTHYDIFDGSETAIEVVGVAAQFKQKDIGKQLATIDAYREISSKISAKKRVSGLIYNTGNSDAQERALEQMDNIVNNAALGHSIYSFAQFSIDGMIENLEFLQSDEKNEMIESFHFTQFDKDDMIESFSVIRKIGEVKSNPFYEMMVFYIYDSDEVQF